MRTSLNELKDIEQHLLGKPDPQEFLVFQAKKVLDPGLSEKVFWQRRSYRIIQQYGRRQLRQELVEVEQQLFHTTAYQNFRNRILRYFRS